MAKKTSPPKKSPSKKIAVATEQITVFDARREPSFLAHALDVDRVHQILRSAELGDTRDLFSLYRDLIASDAHSQGEFSKRKIAVLGDEMSILPFDQTSPADVDAADFVETAISKCRSFLMAGSALMDGCLYPVSVVEKVFKATGNSSRPFALADLVTVPYHLLDYVDGTLKIFDTDAAGNVLSTKHIPDSARYIIHRGHILTSLDNWGGPMRSILFWWLLSTMDREWWARFLDRYGSPFLVGKYDRNDNNSRGVLERAFSMATRLGGLVVSDGTSVELKEAAASSSGDAYEKFLAICQREKSKLIIGQTLSAESQSTGLGSGVSEQHEMVRQDIRKFDARLLAATLRDQLFQQLLFVNGMAANAPIVRYAKDVDSDRQNFVGVLKELRSTDFEIDDSEVDRVSGIMGIKCRRRPASSMMPFAAPEVAALRPFRRGPSMVAV
jgi:phage gp29-like protein